MSQETSFRILYAQTGEDKERFTQAWHSVWLEKGYASPADNIIEKYARFDSFSVDYMLMGSRNEVVGTMRIINQNDKVGLPVLNDFSITWTFCKEERLCEATLLTVRKAEREQDSIPVLLLLAELWRYVRANNLSGIVIAADIRLWYLLRQKFNLCFTEIGIQKMYEGSLTVPGYLNVAEQKQRALGLIPGNLFEEVMYKI